MTPFKKKTPSVDTIMSSFQKTLTQLDTVITSKNEEASAELDIAKAAEDRSFNAYHEALRAERVAAKIADLID